MDGTKRDKEPPAGVIRNISIRNVIAHGTGTSTINGHPDSWLDGIRFDNVRLFVSHDPQAPYENTQSALNLRYARNVTMKDVEIRWEKPESPTWKTGLQVDQRRGLAPGRRGRPHADDVDERRRRDGAPLPRARD